VAGYLALWLGAAYNRVILIIGFLALLALFIITLGLF
jgi:hypothetical protein